MRSAEVKTVTTHDDGTLAGGLHSLALAQLPVGFYQALQLAVPAAVQLWMWGWHRSAGWMIVASAFGIWALCEQRFDEAGDTSMGSPPPGVWTRVCHRVAGLVGGGLALGLLLELFLQLLSFGFRCPGCAG